MKEYEKMLELAEQKVPEDAGEQKRFEVPEPEIDKERGKTIVSNIQSIASSLNRTEEHLSDFLGDDMGTSVSLEDNKLEISGEFRKKNVAGRVDNYISEYVTCRECGSPDTERVKKKEVEILRCQACGARNVLD
jgi:translation initiation factor 2 subunit 2